MPFPKGDTSSSAKAHIHGVKEKILGEALFESGQMEDYIELMKANIKEEEISNIRNHTRSGRPTCPNLPEYVQAGWQ